MFTTRWYVLASLLIIGSNAWSAPETVAALIQRQSQEFSDASARNDGAVFRKYLDDNVVFMNETGAIATKKDIVDGAVGGPVATPTNQLLQKDFMVKVFGNVAVTSFTDASTVHRFGQVINTDYRSTEVWRLDRGHWKMISSQTMTVPVDPKAVQLPASDLQQYVGRYQADPTYIFTISLVDGELMGEGGGAPAFPIKVEAKDVLFTPGQPTLRRIFQRDGQGRIEGFVSRREGHDLVLTKIS